MTLAKGLTRLVLAAGLFAFVLGLAGALANTAYADHQPPAVFYGTDTSAGDEVEAFIDGVSCGSATATADGWVIQIDDGTACEAADGDDVSFTLNGTAVEEHETWTSNGSPADIAAGTTLTAMSGAPMPSPPDTSGAPAPSPPDTGNAGLAGATGSAPWLALSLGVLSLVVLAGARTVTERSR